MIANIVNHNQKPSQPHVAFSIKTKKGWESFFPFLSVYACFFSIMMVNRPTTMIATSRPAIAGMKYWSAIGVAGVCVGVAVAAAGSTVNAVIACDG